MIDEPPQAFPAATLNTLLYRTLHSTPQTSEPVMSTTVKSQNTLLKVILAILLPPLAVFMDRGVGTQFILNIVLTLVGFWIIGIIHALIVVL